MSADAVSPVVFSYQQSHARVLHVVEDLSEEQLHHRASRTVHTIAFNVWHLARWADHLQEHLPRMNAALAGRLSARQEVWQQERLADRWGFRSAALGYQETGMRMEEEVAATLPFPSKEVVLAYARRAFALADEAVGALDAQLLAGPNEPELRQQAIANPASRFTVVDALLSHLSHNNRHLGEIECLRGLLGLRGTATQ